MSQRLAPGTWPSPLTAAKVAEAGVGYDGVAVAGQDVWWVETRPNEGGRTTVLRRHADGPAEEVLPPHLDARTRVHEYGGRCWLPLDDGLVTSNLRDQRLYLVRGDEATPLTPDTQAGDRYAEPTLVPGGSHVLCVRERVAERTTHALVAVPLDGSSDVIELWTGSDFVAAPAVSPDGAALAFLTWDHPRMPWDGAEIRVAALNPDLSLGPARIVLGGPDEAAQQPVWETDTTLRAVTDRSGWWNLVRVDRASGTVQPVWPVEQECGAPLWRLGYRTHLTLPGQRVAVVHDGRLAVIDGTDVRDVDVPFTGWGPWLDASGDVVVGIAWTGQSRPAVVAVDTRDGSWREVAGPEQPDPDWVPVPEKLLVPSRGGRAVHATLYPPRNPHASLPDGAAPPVVVNVHGGPTAHSFVRYSPEIAYFTSRGIGYVDVDYGGSTGHGRAYREALRGQWGVVDVEDCEAVARHLLEVGRASAVTIRGGSAGGWTVLAALTRGDSPFAAGVSYYGVADAAALAEHTHDFESRYLDGLIGPLPQERAVYEERSPLSHVERLDRPVLLLQGLEDPVVPPAQAEAFLAALRDKHIPHAYVAFDGESHGFRRAESITAALEAELSFSGQVLGFEPPDVPRLELQT